MKKTSVYLPDVLKDALGAAAARSGRSEADLIRSALGQVLHGGGAAHDDGLHPAPRPRVRRALPDGPCLVGVGIGPGDPDLLTGRARQVLRRADRVFAPTTSPDAVGRAEAVVRAAAPDVGVERLVLHIAPDSGARQASLGTAAERIAACLDAGELVAFASLGDPHVYSPFPGLSTEVRRRRPGTRLETVPGIMAFQELAAQTGTVLANDGEQVALVTLGDDPTALDALLDQPDVTVVIYRGGRQLPAVAHALGARDRLEGTMVGELLGLPGERSVPLGQVADLPGSYLATTIVPARRGSAHHHQSQP